jgi:CheY-like chemotaxis protein
MDIQMPILDGYSATREIRKWELSNHKSPTPIVAVTANALSHEKQASLDSGCNYHITKPFKKELLLSVIINMTEKTPNEKVNE